MTTVVVFGFAVADGLSPVVGAASYEVLARQLPRMLVERLNGSEDQGVRFLPFLGPIEGVRSFLRLHDMLQPAALARLHKQGDVRLLCDGMLRAGVLHWRALDGRTQKVLHEADLPFDPRQPLDALTRIEFEVMGLLGRTGRPRAVRPLTGEALGWWLVVKDAALRREANLADPSPDPLRPARRCIELAAADEEVQQAVLDFTGLCLKRGETRTEVGPLLAQLAAAIDGSVPVLERLGAQLLAAGDESTAALVALRAARQAPERRELVERAAAQLFGLGRYDEVREVVGLARERGVASAEALAQFAAACDVTGDRNTRTALVAELIALPDLSLPVARLVVSFLIEDDRPAMARNIAERALVKEPGHAVLHFELGRACLLLGDGEAAAPALEKALQLGLAPKVDVQARRFLRLASVPGLWAATQRIESAIAAGDLQTALAAGRALVRKAGVAEAWFLVGIVNHKLEQPRRAERALRRAVRCDASFADAHNWLGILLVGKGRVAQGHRHLLRAHDLAPSDASPLLHLAQACALLGRSEEAERYVLAAERAGAEERLVQAVRREFLARPA
ncbi:MAG TPA: hypothetical protein VF384_16740 [Planctomycetota bacterium]